MTVKFLTSVIADKCWGEKYRGSILPCHVNTKENILAGYRKEAWPKKISQTAIREHQQGLRTIYFTGAWRQREAYTLTMIDVDVDKVNGKGSPEGAQAFAKYISDKLLPGTFFEPSTNGKGQHGYLLIFKKGKTAQEVNHALKHLQSYLRSHSEPFDIEKVEIKGTCMVADWKYGECKSVTLGQLAKLPRGDISNTAHLSLDDLLKLKVVERKTLPEQGRTQGSTGTIGQDYLDRRGEYEKHAQALMCRGDFSTNCKAKITRQDVSIFMMLLHFFTNNANKDGTLPWARFRGAWTRLYEDGQVDRQFHNGRFANIRNECSRLGLIEWTSNEYCYMGRKAENYACKWRGSDTFIDMVMNTHILTITANRNYLTPKAVFPKKVIAFEQIETIVPFWEGKHPTFAA